MIRKKTAKQITVSVILYPPLTIDTVEFVDDPHCSQFEHLPTHKQVHDGNEGYGLGGPRMHKRVLLQW